MGDEERAAPFSEDCAVDEGLAFAAFVFAHLGCGDEVVELRLGARLLLEWCPVCARMATFGFPVE